MLYVIRPLTRKMFETPRKCRAIELSKTGRNICAPNDFKESFNELYTRGLIDTKALTNDGKEIINVFVTTAGINLLNSLN